MLAALALAAGPAGATRVSVPVVNDAAPWVRIVSPGDGARLVAGADVVVRVESGDADRTSMVVDGVPVWSGPGRVLQGSWAPDAGPHRLVALAVREGAPDAVAFVDVVAVAPGAAPAPGPAAPGAGTDPGASAPGPAPLDPVDAAPGGPAPADGRPGMTPGDGAGPAPPPGGTAGPDTADAGGAGGRERDDDRGGGPFAALLRLLGDPERVAWGVAVPLLLLIAAGAYALLQRYIDGGQKLAWRGRGRPDDSVVEF